MYYDTISGTYRSSYSPWTRGNTDYPAPALMTEQDRLSAGLEECVQVGSPSNQDFYYTTQDRSGSQIGYTNVAKEIPVIKQILHHKITAKKDALISAGIPATFPDGVSVVQTRNQIDLVNLTGSVVDALSLKADGVTSPVIPYITQDNVTHVLTPDQMISIGRDVKQRIAAIYVTARQKKDSLEGLDFDQLVAYDVEGGWD